MTFAIWSAPLFSLRGCSREAAPNSSAGSKSACPSPGQADCKHFGLRLRKSCVPHVGSSKRRAHAANSAASSVSARREGSLPARSESSAQSGIAEPHRGPIQTTRSGAVAPGCIAGSLSPTSGCLQHPRWRSSLACLSSALWLPGTAGRLRFMARAWVLSPC